MGQRLALLIANDRYTDESLADLYSPREEARDLRSLLADADVGAFDHTVLLENESKSAVERAIETMLRTVGPEDLFLLYFSGHGIRSGRQGRLYLAVANTELDALSSTAISSVFIHDLLADSHTAGSVILLDCCYSGAFDAEGLKSTDEQPVDGGLSNGNGRYVITATNSVERADDGRPATEISPRLRSAFTETIIQGLSTGAADITGNGRITPEDLWRYVRLELPKRAPNQSPCQFGRASDEIHIALSRDGHHRQRRHRDQREVRLGDLLGPLEPSDDLPLCATEWRRRGLLKVPIGQAQRIDQPAGEPVWLDLASTEGHLLLVGRAGTGKTTLLRSIIGGLALTHTDREVAFYCLESGGNWLGPMRRLPHVRAVVGDDEVDEVDKLLGRLELDVLRRKQLFREHELESPTSLRAKRATLDSGPYPDVFLVVDRWQDFATLIDDFTPRVTELANKGLGYGIHVAVLDRSWRTIPEELLELPQSRIETRLTQPHESLVNPDHAGRLPANVPGWAVHGRQTFRIALPDLSLREVDGEAEPVDGAPDGAAALVSTIAEAWAGLVVVDGPTMPSGIGARPRELVPPNNGPVDPVPPPDEVLTVLGIPDYSVLADFTGDSTPVGPDYLRVPIGLDDEGEPVLLDIKEAAQEGDGPHGLVVGATGSGKSELLRTLVAALAMRHTTEELNFVLIDYKGGATFGPLGELPHTIAQITHLAEDLSLVDRMTDVLESELQRRQQMLRAAGHLGSRWEYDRTRQTNPTLAPMPSVLVVCDEFSELLSARPEFVEVFIRIGRMGRALGVHLLLASQRIEEGRLRGLENHLSYRIGMRTFSSAESRAVLGVADAYELPNAPGHGYLKANTVLTRFRAGYVSGPYQVRTAPTGDDEPLGPTVLDVVIRRLRDARPPAHRIWLPPLGDPPGLDSLMELVTDARLGLGALEREPLTVPVGMVDLPREHRQDRLLLDLTRPAGNVAVVGAPRSGKSTLVASIIAGLALTHTPREVQFFCLDFGGGSLANLAELPHLSGLATRREPESVRRTVAEVEAVIDEREARFARLGIDSIGAYRRRRVAGEFPDDPFGDLFLVADGWSALRQDYEELEQAIALLAARGPGVGVHVVLTAVRWTELRPALRDLLGIRLELRLTDPSDSEIDRRAARSVSAGGPGRGLSAEKLHFVAAAPRIDGRSGDGGLAEATVALARRIRDGWPGQPAPKVRLLPRTLTVADLARVVDPVRPGLPIGVNESALAPVYLEPSVDPHLLVFGDAECGKSNLLRHIARTIAARYTPAEARIVIADYRRSLLRAVEGEHLINYASSNQAFSEVLDQVRKVMQERLPATDITPAQLRDRSWWQGPDLYLLVDDYDLVATGGGNPLAALLDLLPQARDIGLHLILARRVSGVARAQYEPVLQRLRELESPGLLMSGNREEGAVFGSVRPTVLPPGRGTLVRHRDGVQVIQTVLAEP
ncbi:type VII secretion protein EccCb [Micromonospora sp. NBC_01699]|uniref:type VII secretion protein EccCb n=1 Tax=Micromonospora sp. NBC_01699 TaxID=2975984 RepID=UPI002E2971DA|nr:type VII secretion protein EccCb [Micromonospora sp. NBC_01699]